MAQVSSLMPKQAVGLSLKFANFGLNKALARTLALSSATPSLAITLKLFN